VLRVRNDGVPILGFTWYSLIDQMDWDTALREANNRVTPVGLYDLDRNPRAVGRAYKQLIADWQTVLPTQSLCLQVPVVLPSEYDAEFARRRRGARRRSAVRNPAHPAQARDDPPPADWSVVAESSARLAPTPAASIVRPLPPSPSGTIMARDIKRSCSPIQAASTLPSS
jgi:hypothetical protein